jgi:hypothetical protein
MAYVPDWGRLGDVLARVVKTGLSEQEAQRDICNAIADRKIRVRLSVEFIIESPIDSLNQHRFRKEYGNYSRQVFDGTISLELPFWIVPAEFSWVESRFELPWRFQPGMKGFNSPVTSGRVGIELFNADVTSVLCTTRAPHSIEEHPSAAASFGSGAKSRGISDAIDQLWSDGIIPNGLSAKDRDRAIIEWIDKAGGSVPSNPARAIQRVLKARRSKPFP